jgi:uncharacterized repeat protein (TIGR01451 family)/MYXO-CTERM domain-containing protein
VTPANPLDACSDLAPGSLTGQLGLIRRGNCNFQEKADRAAAAGATGVIVFDADAGPLVTMASIDGGTLDVPAVFITNADGVGVLQRLDAGTVQATWGSTSQISNTDTSQQRVLLYTPNPSSPGSTLSHWNSGSYPKALLMEPFLSSTARVDLDLTPASLADLGWPVFTGLAVGMSKGEAATVQPGAQATYLIAVFNHRATQVDGVKVDLAAPAGTTFVSASGGCTALPCTVGSVAAGEVRGVVVTVQAPKSITYPYSVTANLTAPTSDPGDSLSTTISANQSTSSGGGGCSAGGASGAVFGLLVVLAAGFFARRRRSAA